MATTTPNLKLILPANNEYFNTWDQPTNGNFTIIDTAVGAVTSEVIAARGSAASLNARLSAAMDPGGNLNATPEVATARVSTVYGGFDPITNVALDLDGRLEQGDREEFYARQGLSMLVDGEAWGVDQNKNNAILVAPTNYLTASGGVVTLNGGVSTVVANINGYRQVVRVNKTVTVTGSAGTYFLSLSKVTGGDTYLSVPSAATGQTAIYNGNTLVAKFTDNSQNFVTLGVQPGDILNVTGPSGNPNIGSFIVLATNTQDSANLTTSDLAVYGQFSSAVTGLNYTLSNPFGATLGFTGTAHAKSFARVANKIFIGRCVFDGSNVTGITEYQPLGVYAGFTSIALTGGAFSVTIPHNIGYFPSKVHIYASQASDFSQPLELLSVADISGGGSLQRSVIAQMTDLTISIKNTTSGLFYKDFNGTSQTTGFLYVVVER